MAFGTGSSSSTGSSQSVIQQILESDQAKAIGNAVLQGVTGGITSGVAAQVGGGIGGSINNAAYAPGGAIGQAQAAQSDYMTQVPASQTSSQGSYAGNLRDTRQFQMYTQGQQHAHERYLQATALAAGRDLDGPKTPKEIVDGVTNKVQTGHGVVREVAKRADSWLTRTMRPFFPEGAF